MLIYLLVKRLTSILQDDDDGLNTSLGNPGSPDSTAGQFMTQVNSSELFGYGSIISGGWLPETFQEIDLMKVTAAIFLCKPHVKREGHAIGQVLVDIYAGHVT